MAIHTRITCATPTNGLFALLSMTAVSLWLLTASAFAEDGDFAQAVQAYRSGDYTRAEKILTILHSQHPELSNVTYYMAITAARQGDIQKARQLYQEVMTLDPNSRAASLAKTGLAGLPVSTDAMLDEPPSLTAQVIPAMPVPVNPAPYITSSYPVQPYNHAASGYTQPTTQTSMYSGQPAMGNNGQPPYASQPDPAMAQELMAVQQMMGNSGNNNNNSNNWMMPMIMQAQQGNAQGSGAPALSPDAISSMMMNQMMQNFDMGGSKNNNND